MILWGCFLCQNLGHNEIFPSHYPHDCHASLPATHGGAQLITTTDFFFPFFLLLLLLLFFLSGTTHTHPTDTILPKSWTISITARVWALVISVEERFLTIELKMNWPDHHYIQLKIFLGIRIFIKISPKFVTTPVILASGTTDPIHSPWVRSHELKMRTIQKKAPLWIHHGWFYISLKEMKSPFNQQTLNTNWSYTTYIQDHFSKGQNYFFLNENRWWPIQGGIYLLNGPGHQCILLVSMMMRTRNWIHG